MDPHAPTDRIVVPALLRFALAAALIGGCAGSIGPPSAGSSDLPVPASPAPTATTETLSGRIAFQRHTSETVGAYVIDPDGQHERLLAADAELPRWSPDGALIALAVHKPGDRLVVGLVAPDGSGLHVLEPDPTLNYAAAAWSPDGQWLAVETWDETDPDRNGIYLMHPDGTGLRKLTNGGIPGAFSPDGRQLAFIDFDSGGTGGYAGPGHLAIVDFDGSNQHRVGDLEIGPYPGFMPDGQSLYAFASGRIVVVDLSGRHLREIRVDEPKLAEGRLAVDGRHFVVVYDPQAVVAPGVWRIGVDGSGFAKVVHTNVVGIEESAGDWGP
jgi:WD40-like Beta Propeller Repeat